jgi:hypothetical protein
MKFRMNFLSKSEQVTQSLYAERRDGSGYGSECNELQTHDAVCVAESLAGVLVGLRRTFAGESAEIRGVRVVATKFTNAVWTIKNSLKSKFHSFCRMITSRRMASKLS